ncbi:MULTISPECIES: fimbrial protein [Burkholderia]|nr:MULTISPECIES: fimbrial protein [Burkholderia]EKS9798744.1 type 1 fimbrial protein [Burkholderia cepacia]EKS9803164.1 type 1 fimbrial protein [Burkholderia cepacia]EKS9810648.1 type 1 fimbrial protein [Burkholderia cepacia]EKS9819621.1 type 1 fimbrial protein [Burkholderia cepacia]EKS9827239.1 type 1 fimbrial protein [Burkholderia cepacia]
MKKIFVLVWLLVASLKVYAVSCWDYRSGAMSDVTELPVNLYVLASTPDGTTIWGSDLISREIYCRSSVKEVISLWVNPEKKDLASGAEVALEFNGVVYSQSSGAISSGNKTGNCSTSECNVRFSLSYRLIVRRKGAAPSSGLANISNYSVFQIDGEGGLNGAQNQNFRHKINGSVKFTRGVCAIRAGDENRVISLKPTLLTKLPGVGGAVGRMPFSLGLVNCDEGVKGATFSFSGTPDSDNKNAFKNDGTAKGVAIYLGNVNSGAVITPSGAGSSVVSEVSSSSTVLNLYGEYVVTRDPATAGTVKSTVIFTVSYQ